MNAIHETSQFRRDIKKLKKQGKNLEKLKQVVLVLVSGDTLDARYRDHALVGSWQGSRDCHIEPDWLFIYRKETEQLFLERTGSHSELFKR
jgi:mRNA interferase YafQ